jgi:hypothetical protein
MGGAVAVDFDGAAGHRVAYKIANGKVRVQRQIRADKGETARDLVPQSHAGSGRKMAQSSSLILLPSP